MQMDNVDNIKIEYFGDDDDDDFNLQRTRNGGFVWDSGKKPTIKNKEFQKKLIIEVQSFLVLYDKSNKDNKSLPKRNEAWEKIGIILDMPSVECQKTWEKLRNSFRHYYSMEKKNRSSGSVDGKSIKWEFYELMSFLKPCIDYSKPAIGSDEPSTSKSISEDEESELSLIFNHEKEPPAKKQKTDNVEQLVGAVSQLVNLELSKYNDNGFYKHLERQARIFLSPKKRLEFEAKCLNLLWEYSK